MPQRKIQHEGSIRLFFIAEIIDGTASFLMRFLFFLYRVRVYVII